MFFSNKNLKQFSKMNEGLVIKIIYDFYLIVKIFGIFGSVVLLILYYQPCLRKLSVSLYMQSLAISSTLDNIFYIIFEFILPNHNSSIEMCKFSSYLLILFIPMSIWFEVAASFDRLLTIVYFNRFKLIRKTSFRVTIILMIIFYSLIFNLSIASNYYLKEKNDYYTLNVSSECVAFDSKSIEKVNFLNTTSLPFCLMLFCSLSTFFGVLRSHRHLRKMFTEKKSHKLKLYRRDLKFGITMIFLNLMFLIMVSPWRLTNIFDYNPFDNETNWFYYQVFGYLIGLLYESYFSLNFYFQFATNSVIRKQVYAFFKKGFNFFCSIILLK